MPARELQALLKTVLSRSPLKAESRESAPDRQSTAYLALLRGVKLLHGHKSDLNDAMDAFQEAFVLYRLDDETRFKSMAQKVIALLLETMDDPKYVRSAYRSAIRMLEAASLPDEAAEMMLNLARFEMNSGKRSDALSALRGALDHFRTICQPAGESKTLVQFGEFDIARGMRSEAHAHAREAEALIPLINDRDTRIEIEARVGRLLAA